MNIAVKAVIGKASEGESCDSCGFEWTIRSRRKALSVVVGVGDESADLKAIVAQIERLCFCEQCFEAAQTFFGEINGAVRDAITRVAKT